ncbi:MAG: hypothetical protein HYR55_19010 [Acidobacteria bacterium]|nr:hypothetical protein [Acidobacteriota bacterium]MBI3657451.1 hypothetical protein [Acidobacteriota bacterium]
MRRTISSAQTYLMKVIFPVIWIGGFTIGTLLLFSQAQGFTDEAGNPPPPGVKWTFLFATLAGGALIYWSCIRLKRVALDDQVLYISNFRQEIVVPLRDIEEVTENRWINIHPVTVHFCRETDFGSSIVFMPKVRWFAFFSSHPIVAELRAASARARGVSPDAPAA